jgi:site-specific DNA-methyltransferase (adenine-specific)
MNAIEIQDFTGPRHQILTGDCLDRLKQLPNNHIDVIVTSPPYNIGIAYRSYTDKKPQDIYLEWLQDIARELKRVLKSDGSFFLNVGSTNVNPWIAMDVAHSMKKIFTLQNHITWVKSITIADVTTGHFKPINSKRFLNHNHEDIFHFTHNGDVILDRLAIGVPFQDKSNISRRGHRQDKRCAGNTWFIPYETVKSKGQKFNHPAGFPVELPTRCIKLHGKPNGIVLDPFLGTGTSLVASIRENMTAIGIEIDPVYAQTAHARAISQYS